MTESTDARLPFVDELRSAQALSRRLGFPVRPQRIRVKPGRSAIVAWRRDGGDHLGGFAEWGWTAVVTSEDKLANLQRRADRLGQSLTIHEAADPRSAGVAGGVLLSGGLLADARLGKEIARALEHLGEGDTEVIGFNPGRRVLLKHTPARTTPGTDEECDAPDSKSAGVPEFVRIAAKSQRHLVETSEQWTDWNLPTLPVSHVGGRRTAVRSPWWGVGDLRALPDRSLAEEVGMIIAELHRRNPAEAVHPIRSSPLEQVGKDAEVLARLLPGHSRMIEEIVQGLHDRLAGEHEERVIHGDLSPDQVLVGHSECRIIDLDRAGVGPAGVDLGRWIASCRSLASSPGVSISNVGASGLEAAFLDGYHRAGGGEVDLGAWSAWAMLLMALEPWRSCSPDWEHRSTVILAEAHAELVGNDRRRGTGEAPQRPVGVSR